MKDEIFVTYAWGTQAENNRVYSLVELLRRNGFKASCDIIEMQQQTSINFKEMMQRGLNYNKVIIVLSKGYKEKADEFRGGVGTEYRTVINDIDEKKNKYILVTFDELTEDNLNNITPYMLKGRYIININRGNEALNELYAKLKDEEIFKFSEVSQKVPEIQSKKIEPLYFEKQCDIHNNEKQYVYEARNHIKSLGIEVNNNSYCESKGTNLHTGIQELEDGRVLSFTCKQFDIIDNNIWYYYNVKNKVIYKYENNIFTKMC